jgi:glutamate---cysteine ligase / carboxylate-amine ligase
VTTGEEIAAAFDRVDALTVGAEEELMLLDPEDRDLVPEALRVLEVLDGDRRFKLELPASQIESLTAPAATVGELVDQLAAARRDLAAAVDGVVDVAAAGAHPTAAPEGEINRGPRYDAVAAQFGKPVMRRQLVCALQIHIAPGDADTALAVYNALRSHLPEIAALAANAPFFDGRDTALASIRPLIAQLLPRQGVPPAFASWDEFAGALEWGATDEVIRDAASWWWELRPHPGFGTLELRVPDAQTTLAEAAAVAAFAHCLAGWLAARHGDGEPLPVHPSWRIAENRWRAARHGVEAELADLDTGEVLPLRDRLEKLLGELRPTAKRLGCPAELTAVAGLAERNGALRQREVVAERGLDGLVGWLCERFLAGDA